MKANRFHNSRPLVSQAIFTGLLVCAILLGATDVSTLAAGRAHAEQSAESTPQARPVPAQARLVAGAPGGAEPVAARPLLQTPVPSATLTQAQILVLLEQQLNAAWNAQDWVLAINLITQIMAIDPNYDDIQTRRYYAHINYGYQHLAALRCTEAKDQFTQAAALRPDGQEAQTALALLPTYCTTAPTVSPTHTWTPGPTSAVSATPTPYKVTTPFVYTVKAGDTLFSLAKTYGTTVQAIMQANGMMAPAIQVGDTITIVSADAPPVGPIVHIVQPGETLRSIAELYHTTVWAIMAANGMSHQALYAYQAIFVPSPLEHGPVVHMTVPGETLVSIAKLHDTAVPLLMLANGLDTYSLHVYQLLVIPPKGWTGGPLPFPLPWASQPPKPQGPGGHPKGPAGDHFYVVQRHDTLFSISRRYGCTVEAIKAANGLHGSTIYVGQKLRIP